MSQRYDVQDGAQQEVVGRVTKAWPGAGKKPWMLHVSTDWGSVTCKGWEPQGHQVGPGASVRILGFWETDQNGRQNVLCDSKRGGSLTVAGSSSPPSTAPPPAQPPASPPGMGYAASDPAWAHGGAAPPLPAFPGQPGQGGPPATSGGSGRTRMGIMAAVSLMREVFRELTVSIPAEQAGPMTTSLFIAASEGRLLDDRPEEPGEDGGEV